MRYFEFASQPQKPLTPSQSRIAALKRNAEVAKNALQAERKAQQIAKAQQKIRKLSAVKPVV
jgi:hypothetical protein